MGIVLYRSSPGMMLKEKECRYGFEETAIELESSVRNHGWTIPAIHDLQASLKKFGHDVRNVKVFEVCNPDIAVKVLEGNNERIVSTMMPCRIAIYEKEDGKVYTSYMNFSLLAGAMGGAVDEAMTTAMEELKEILEAITGE